MAPMTTVRIKRPAARDGARFDRTAIGRSIVLRAAAALVAGFCTFGCVPPKPPPPRPAAPLPGAEPAKRNRRPTAEPAISKHASRRDGLEGGMLVFEDDFERAELGADWTAAEPGEWTIGEGLLRANRVANYDDRNKGCWLKRELPEKVRIEFDAASHSKVGDMKCEVFAGDSGHESGYSIIFGGWNNAINTITRLGEHQEGRVVQKPHVPVESGRSYHWAVVRTDGAVRWYVDGRFMIAYDDPEPLVGRRFGFNNWLSDVRFDRVRVWDLGAAAQ